MESSFRLKRIRFRSWHRGSKETDIVLGNFADHALDSLTDEQLDILEQFLDEDDADIWDWLTNKTEPTQKKYKPLIALMLATQEQVNAT
jgi:antitoxin CptB